MFRFVYLLIAALCFVGTWLSIWAAWPRPEPDLWANTVVFDHGDLSQGQEVRARFDLVNHYSQALEITEIIKGCSCSEATVATKQLQPGEQTTLSVVWKTGRMRGRNTIYLEIVYNLSNGTSHFKQLRLEGNVVPDIGIHPEKLVFDGSNLETQVLQLNGVKKNGFAVSAVYCNHPAFKAELQANRKIQVTFDGKTAVFANGLEPRLSIQSNSPNEPQITVPIDLKVAKPFQ